MQERVNLFGAWCKKNNIEAIKKKTKIMVFRNKKCPRPYKKVTITLNGEEIEEVDYAKILGTIVDNQLNFEKHFDKVVRSGYASLNQVKRFCANQKIPSSETLLTLYKTLIRSIIIYSIPATVNINEKSLREICTLERSCLIYATKSLPKIDSDVLNLFCNTLPLDLHLKLVAAKKYIQILSKNSPVNDALQLWLDNPSNGPVVTTFCKMWMAIKQILKRSSKELQVLPTTVHDGNLPNFRQLNILTHHTRSKEDQLLKVQSMIECNKYDYIIASDGSKLGEGSFGRCGASAVIYKNSTESNPSKLKSCLGTESNNYVAELRGIGTGLQYLSGVNEPSKVLFLCDCVPALESSFSLPLKKDYNNISRSNVTRAIKLQQLGHRIEAAWIPGHCGFGPNEEADATAKEAAEQSTKVRYPAERKEIIVRLKEKVKENWQFRVDIKLEHHKVYNQTERWGNGSLLNFMDSTGFYN